MSEQDRLARPPHRGLDRLRDLAWARQMNDAGEQWRSGLLNGEVAWLIDRVEELERERADLALRLADMAINYANARADLEGRSGEQDERR
jgi:ubiquinone biosynthesis protein UbiJ